MTVLLPKLLTLRLEFLSALNFMNPIMQMEHYSVPENAEESVTSFTGAPNSGLLSFLLIINLENNSLYYEH